MTIDLMKKRVLVTRPVYQAENLCKLIRESNGYPILFPTIEILAPDDKENVNRQIEHLGNFDIGIFISRNSVIKVIDHPGIKLQQLQKLKIFAIGAGTAQQLRISGLENVTYPEDGSDSESLLKTDGLQASQIVNKNIVIFRGQDGREYLARVLKERGANVKYVDVYKRGCPQYSYTEIEKIWSDKGAEIIVVTSIDALKNLFRMLSSEQKKILLERQLVTIGKRIAQYADELGFTSRAIIAEQANDKSLVNAIDSILSK